MENGFSTPRNDKFPAGLRVLVVDDDPTWLKILEKMLRKCLYEVTTCCLARDALKMLRERKDGFDMVISDVNMPDMDGFKLLELVGLEMDLPVIMMSVDGETSRVMKGVQHGACDYLLKPVRMKELSNIWQHVFRKKIHEVKDTESHECMGNIQLMRNESDDFHDEHRLNERNLGASKKRKDMENQKDDEQELVDPLALKKARVVWSIDLHQKFVDAVNQIGFDKVGPKKILDTMNVPWLTRENVASHLQKFRQYLGKMQKENELKASLGEIKQQDFTSGDLPRNFGFENSIPMDLKNAANNYFGYARNKIPVNNMDPKVHEGDLKGMVAFLPVTKPKSALTGDFLDHRKASISSQMNQTHAFQSLDQNFKHQPLESTLPTQNWNEVSIMQFKQPPNQELKPYPLPEDNYSPLLFSGSKHHFRVDLRNSAPSTDLRTSFLVCDSSIHVKAKPQCTQYRSNDGQIEFPVGTINSIPLATGGHIKNQEAFKGISTVTFGMENYMADQNCINNVNPVQQKLIADEQAVVSSLEENSQSFFHQGYGCSENIGYQNVELSDYYNPEIIADIHTQYYDELGFNNDKLRDSIENPFVDQGLFVPCPQAARVHFCD